MKTTPPDHAEPLAYEARIIAQLLQGMNERLRDQAALPAPYLSPVLSDLTLTAARLQLLCRRLSDALAKSAHDYDLIEDDGTDPARSITAAQSHLDKAARAAVDLGSWLSCAYGAIHRQGYRTTPTTTTGRTER